MHDKAEKSAWRRMLGLCVGIAVSALMMWLALRKTSFAEVGHTLAATQLGWLSIVVVTKVVSIVLKNWRWRCELHAMHHGAYVGTFRAIGLGYFGNLVLPFKLGELLRTGLLRRHNPTLRFGDALATIAAERALDGVVLSLLVAMVLPWISVERWVLVGVAVLAAAMIGVIGIAILTPVHEAVLRLLPERGLWEMGRRIVLALAAGTSVLRNRKALALAASLTALAWLVEAGAAYAAARSLGIPIGFPAMVVVTLLLSVGLLVPSAPGQLGTHQALTVFFMAPFGVGASAAVSLSFLLQAATMAVLGSIGIYVLVRESSVADLWRHPPGS